MQGGIAPAKAHRYSRPIVCSEAAEVTSFSRTGVANIYCLQLRQATLILPTTGERVKRRVTLRLPNSLDDANGGGLSDQSPLLSRHSSYRAETGIIHKVREYCKNAAREAWALAISRTGQGVLKCSVAYFLGSMGTFVPAIAAVLGQQDGKHMVATITVYFHPARSQGSMIEAVLLAFLAFIYAAIVSFSSMGVSILFGRTLDLIVVGHIIVLIVFCGGSLGLIGWAKQRLANPLVNVACSLASLAIITVLTKEGAVQASMFSDDKVVQVMKMILMGVIVTTAVCFLIRPVSARKELRENMINVTDSFADMLSLITKSFLTGTEEDLQQASFLTASARYRNVLSSLAKNLKEAKYEHYFMGTEVEYHLQAKLVNCMQRLAQNIGGLRSAAITQFTLLAQPAGLGGATPINSSIFSPKLRLANSVIAAMSTSPPDNYGVLTAIDEHSEEDEQTEDRPRVIRHNVTDEYNDLPTVQSPLEIFERFIVHLGPSMVKLSSPTDRIPD